jgi:hypothetical protein
VTESWPASELTVRLDGSRSQLLEALVSWTALGPAAAFVSLSSAGDVGPTASLSRPGVYDFQLTVLRGGVAYYDRVRVWRPRVWDAAVASGECFIGRVCAVSWSATGFNGAAARVYVFVSGASNAATVVVAGSLTFADPAPPSDSRELVFRVPSSWLEDAGASLQVVVDAQFPTPAVVTTVRTGSVRAASVALRYPYQWTVGDFGACSVSCGGGVRQRDVWCADVTSASRTIVADALCAARASRPTASEGCFPGPCASTQAHAFVVSDFGACSSACGDGEQRRDVWCVAPSGSAVALSECEAALSTTAPPTSRSCTRGVCDTFQLVYSAYGPCSRSCGGGVQRRVVSCRSVATSSVVALPLCSSSVAALQGLERPCNEAACTSSWAWTATSDWTACSALCSGGVSSRTVQCVNTVSGLLSTAADSDCGAVPPSLSSSRACNVQPCVSYQYHVSVWSECVGGCGGTRTRIVQCRAHSTSGVVDVPLTMCQRSLGDVGATPTPASSEACPPCTFCSSTTCSGHGTCNAATQACDCVAGFHGVVCQSSDGCSIVDASGACCAAGSILDVHDRCCHGLVDGASSAASVEPVLDAHGECCASGVVNACGECDGPPAAVVSAVSGLCCTNGVTGANGECCDSGDVDSYGLCNGHDASGTQDVVLSTGLPSGVDVSTLHDALSTSRRELDRVVRAWFGNALGRDEAFIVVDGYTTSAVRRLEGDVSVRLLSSDALQIRVLLLPFGGANVMSPVALTSALTSASPAASALLSNLQSTARVVTAVPMAVCGNGLCEAGELPDVTSGAAGCATDCPLPLLTCRSVNGLRCNGVGVCATSSVGTSAATSGFCVCGRQGYAGADCTECAEGFVRTLVSGAPRCVKLETRARGSGNASGNASNVGVCGPRFAAGPVCLDPARASRCGLAVSLIQPSATTSAPLNVTCVACPHGLLCPNATTAITAPGGCRPLCVTCIARGSRCVV